MFTERTRNAAFVVAGAVLAAGLLGAVVSADHAWGNYHWARASNPVSLTVGQNFGAHWQQHFDVAVTDWNQSRVLDLTAVAGGTTPRQCKAQNGKIEVCSESYGNTGWLGIAQIWADGDHIVRAVAKMNDFYMGPNGFAPYTAFEWRQLVMCQEVGHDFGLGHQDEDFDNQNLGTCMDYTSAPASNQHPDAHDFAELEEIYTHFDDGSDGGGGNCNPRSPKCSGGQQPPPAFDMDLPGVAQWGRLVRTSPDGGQSLFVQDFGNGFRVYTHVTWTLEVAAQARGRR
jgi:hypothetical protein